MKKFLVHYCGQRAIVSNPEEAVKAIESFHKYGRKSYDTLIVNTYVSEVIEDLFSDDPKGYVRGERWGMPTTNKYDMRYLRTTNCGSENISFYPALGDTVEEHEAAYSARCEEEKRKRMQEARERRAKAEEDFNKYNPGKWALFITSPYDIERQLSFWATADSKKEAWEKLQQPIRYAFRASDCTPDWMSFTFEKFYVKTIDDIEQMESEERGRSNARGVKNALSDAKEFISWCDPADENDADGRYWLSAYHGCGPYRLIVSGGKIVGSIEGGFHGSNPGKVSVASWAKALIQAAKERYPDCHLIKAEGSGTYFYLFYDEHKSLFSNIKEYYVPTYGSPLLTKNMEIH